MARPGPLSLLMRLFRRWKRNSASKERVRVFSLKRLLLSIILGILFLSSYVFGLFLIDLWGQTPPNLVLLVIGWPRWLWILMGRQFSGDDLVSGLAFLAFCDTVLYAVMIYSVLLALASVRRKRTGPDPPPPPQDFSSRSATSSGSTCT